MLLLLLFIYFFCFVSSRYPVYGFGGKGPDRNVSHCFPLDPQVLSFPLLLLLLPLSNTATAVATSTIDDNDNACDGNDTLSRLELKGIKKAMEKVDLNDTTTNPWFEVLSSTVQYYHVNDYSRLDSILYLLQGRVSQSVS